MIIKSNHAFMTVVAKLMRFVSHYAKNCVLVFVTMCSMTLANKAYAETLTIFTYEIPGLVAADNQRPAGVAVETIRMLFERAGYQVKFELHPFARVKSSVSKYANSCGFPVNYSTKREQAVDYLLPLTLVQTQFYSLHEGSKSLEDIGQSYVVSLVQHTAQPQLESMDLSLLYVTKASTAINLLIADRADYLVLDDTMANAAAVEYGVPMYPVYTLANNATYIVCNKSITGLSQALVEQTFIDMLQDGSLRNLWQDYEIVGLFDAMFGEDGAKWQKLLNQFRVARGDKEIKTSADRQGE